MALADWVKSSQRMLRGARRLHRQVLLCDARALLENDAEVLAHLAPSLDAAPVAEDVPAAPNAIWLVLADALVKRDEEAARCAAEIAAMRIGTGREMETGDASTALGEVRDMKTALDRAQDEMRVLVEERQLLRDHIALQEETIERAEARSHAVERLESEIAELRRDNEMLREAARRHTDEASETAARICDLEAEYGVMQQASADRHLLKAKADALQRRIEVEREEQARRAALLGSLLLADQRDLDTSAGRIEALEGRVWELGNEVAQLRADLDSVYSSRSWRLTRPLRSVRAMPRLVRGA
ncbi:hypothetical protein [Roseovarius aquimarinus]|uniref:Chromosome partition protein Smc n=1 Tax=Roseovarius aquimarinus TaxID=1229156 RepID=A0ABW7IAJ8_9RHOB